TRGVGANTRAYLRLGPHAAEEPLLGLLQHLDLGLLLVDSQAVECALPRFLDGASGRHDPFHGVTSSSSSCATAGGAFRRRRSTPSSPQPHATRWACRRRRWATPWPWTCPSWAHPPCARHRR